MGKNENSFGQRVVGRVSWDKPSWAQKIRTKHVIGTVIGLVVVLGGLIGGLKIWHWYKSRPKPDLVTFTISAPEYTPLTKELRPDVVTIQFSKSAAPKELIGKKVLQGITLSPAIAGEWIWIGEKGDTLQFNPKQDWPANQDYQITFDPTVVAPHIKLAEYQGNFRTLPFKVEISNQELYQNPFQKKEFQVNAQLTFTHPVQTESVKPHVVLEMAVAGVKKEYPFEVKFDSTKRKAFIRSNFFFLPDESSHMWVRVLSGILPFQGQIDKVSPLEVSVIIPDNSSYLTVKESSTIIVKNQSGDPEQVLSMQFSSDVKAQDVIKNLKVYVLPEMKDEDGKVLLFKSVGEVTNPDNKKFLESAKILDLVALPTERDTAEVVFFRFRSTPKQQLYVKLDAGVRSPDGFIIKKDYDNLLEVPMFPKEVQIQHQGSLLSLSGDKKISLMTRGIAGLQIQVGRVLEGRVPYLVTQTRNWGNFQKPTFSRSDEFSENDITEIFTEVQDLHMQDPSKAIYTVFDLEKYLTQNGKRKQGLFLIKVQAWDPKSNQKVESENSSEEGEGDYHGGEGEGDYEEQTASMPVGETQDNRFILVTDLGVLVKSNENKTKDIFVQSIAAGGPVGGAEIAVLGRNGLAVTQVKTSVDGHATLPNLDDLKKEKAPVVYLVKQGADLSFLPYDRQDRKLNFSRFDISGIYHDNHEAQLRAQLFSDRGIYRPGEEVHIGMIAKQENWSAKMEGIPISMSVIDSRDRVLHEEKRALSAAGFEEFQFSTRPDSPTGDYRVQAYLVKDKNENILLGTINIKVSEFQPDRMKIETRLTESLVKGWVSSDKIKASVTLTQLFGAPAENRKVDGTMNLSRSSFWFSEYKDYRFADPLENNFKNLQAEEHLPAQTTDQTGHVSFALPLSKYADINYRLTFSAEGFEAEGGRSVSNASTVLVSSLPYLIGTKADGDISFIKPNSKRTLELIAINSDLQKVAVNHILAKWLERKYVSTLMKQENGTFKYQSILQKSLIKEETLDWTEEGKKLDVLTDKPGDFELVLSASINGKVLELAKVDYTVAGEANLDVSRSRNAELKVSLSKKEYKAGEEVELQINAPYTGAGLITIERDKVYAFKWFKSNTTASKQTITIPANFEGNGYINVAFVRDLHSKEIFMSPLSYGVVPFSVDREKRTVHVEIVTKDQVRPGEEMTIQVKSDKPAKAIVYAVDEGILQVARYQTPDPLGFFMKKRALEVETSQILDLLLPEYSVIRELSQAGGGESEEAQAALGKNLNPFRRKADKPVVFWSGIVDVGPQSKELHYLVPDSFAGSLRFIAIAVSAEAVGKQEEHVLAKGDFVISPNAPLFLAPSDQVDMSVSVFNNIAGSGKDVPVQVSLVASDSFDVVGNKVQTLPVSEGHESVAHFMVKAKDKLGSAELIFVAAYQDKKSKRTISTSIRPAVPYRTKLKSGHVKKENEEVALSGTLYKEFYKADVSLSYLPVSLVPGILRYVEEFPYGCSEQTTSKAFSILPLGTWGPSLGVSPERVKESLNRAINILISRQNDQGAIGYWTVSDVDSISFITVYATHFLTEAKEEHMEVPPQLLKKALGYLETMVAKTPSSLSEARTLAYGLYVLTRNGIVKSNEILHLKDYLDKHYPDNSLWSWKKDITGVYLAAAYQLLQQSKEAEALIGQYVMAQGEKEEKNFDDFYQPLGNQAQYVMILSKHFPERLASLSSKSIEELVAPIAADEYNTLAGAYAVQALFAYGKQVKEKAPTNFGLTFVDQSGAKTELQPSAPLVAITPIPQSTNKIILTGEGANRPYYQVVQSGFNKFAPEGSFTGDLEIYREYRDAKGKPITSAQVGQEITVVLRVRSLKKDQISRVAVVELLPGGFDVVSESVASGSNFQGMDFVDVREDRVVFFGSFYTSPTTLTYKIRATNAGTFQVPPAFGQAMYHPQIETWTKGSSIVVSPR